MARRKSEIATIDPTPEAEQKSSVSHHCGETPTLRNRRGKHLTRKKSGRSQNHIQSAEPLACRVSVSGRTRAQTKQQQQAESRSSRGGKQYKRQETKENPIFSSISSSSAHSISRTVSTVAATTSRGMPSSGQGPATRSRLREKVRIETPDSSSNYGDNLAEVERRQEVVPGAGRNAWDYVGDLHVEGRRRHDNVEEENRHDIYAADEEVRRDKRDDEREEEEGPKEENGDDNGDSDADSNASGDEDDEGENGDENNEREWEVEGCRCTSTWSCGGHAGQRCAGPSASTPKLGGKRRLASFNGFDEGDDMSPSKRSCHEKSRQSLRPLFDLKFGGAGSSVKPARQRIPSREHPPHRLQQWLDMFKSWSNAERMMALDDLILLCEPSQVRHMMQIIEPQFQRDFISLLPKELALYVLSFLEPRDLLRAAQTCRYWHVLCEDNLLWREKCREEGIDETLVYGSRLRRRPGQHSPCKALYMRQSQIERNWRRGASKSPKILKGHDDHVITCLEFCGHRIVSGSDDNTLKVWSVLSGKCLRTLVGHTGGVWSSQMSGNIIISGSTDRTLKVWNADTGACKHTLYGHTSTVRCMSLCGNRVVSGSRDATLRVWDIETGQCLHVLMGHVAAVRCVQFDGRRVVSGAYDYTVRVWDPETETCLHTLQGHSNRVYSLQFDGVHVVSGSLDTSIRVWDVESGACLHTLIGHQSLTSGLELKDNILVSGNADSTVKVWDITTGQCLQTLQGTNKHQSAVTCLQFSKKFVITSSDDGTVKIWDLKTGDFLRNLVSLDSGGSGGVVWRLRCSNTKLVCAVGSRNGTEETKLMVIDFDVEEKRIA